MSNKTAPKKKHHPTTAPQSAPKPAEPADTPLSWAYPFTPIGKADATDPMTYFKALAKCENGFYPLGVSGMWHGGVHFADGSAEMLKQDSGVRAIADGKIVAYRLNTKYEETTYPNNLGLAHYSTGFVLVRHELKLSPKPAPKEPAKPAPASAPASAPAPASTSAAPPAAAPADNAPSNTKPANDKPLVFFSLYMHTMDWATYQKAIEQAKANPKPDPALPMPMSYWEGDRYYRVGDKAKDQQSVPKAPVQSPAARTDGADNLPINNTSPNEPIPTDSDQDVALPAPQTGLRIRELPNGKCKILGILPTGAEVIAGDGDPAHTDWIKIKAIKSGTILPAEVGKPVSPQAPWGYVFKGELDAVVDPKPLDTVVILKEPQRVKAGEVVAHVGQYQWPMKASPIPPKPNYPMLHLEVFTGADFKDFMERSRARAKELNERNKPLLEIEPGAKLVSGIPEPDQTLTQAGLKLVPIGDAKGSRWVKVQPKSVTNVPAKGKQKATQHFTNVGNPMWVESTLANTISTANVPGWKNFPLDVSKANGPGADFRDVLRPAQLDKLGEGSVAIDDKGHHWWNITIGLKDGSELKGWVCETGQQGVQLRSPWEWPGFELVDNGSVSPADMFKRHIHTTEQYLADEDGTEFMGEAAKVNAGELITKLEKAIDTDHDGKVSAQELKHALETRWMAEAVSHLVVRNETEWGGGLGKWEELTPLMQKQTEMWKTELDRLAKLQWWEQIKGVDGFPTDLSPWHFHTIGLIGNFMVCSAKCKTNVLEFLTTEGMFYASVEGFHLILDSEGFGEIPYVPKNSQSSGVTFGYGYDLGQQTEAMVRSDLDGFFTEDEISRLLTALGKRGGAARKFISSFSDIKISEPKALELAKRVKKRYAQFTIDAFPGTTKLHPHCQGALLSLVYNRGSQLEDKPGQKSRVHMRNINAAIQNKNLPEVPVQLRAMKVLWEGTGNDGLLTRRENEAILFEKGMICDCWR
ncbi:calcium-binding protein [Burkholderia lata]|uniref:pesticin C-terminus-like muramidase n=1 Tax=Burkholderia lata (strain ATCC 17760 / DSM 23089 / LMG 22485 / NCIMB 9086 / R18194 / 383) TaxID=482957 RepID=UPI00084183B9|nr:pesticin C-terminus-like muramidase [Burkholderia lata]AOJ42235.1 calcium-binding protein [Burkholderia lata]